MSEIIVTSALRKALATLQEAIAQPKNDFIRDAVIQRFEYTFELSWKLLKRYLKQYRSDEELSIKNTLRESARLGLITDPEKWFLYQHARNQTSHNYNEKRAEEVYQTALEFAQDAARLLETLERRIAHDANQS